MKAFSSTLSVLLFFIVIFSLSSVLSSKAIDSLDIVIRNSILDKVYHAYISIEYGVERILEEESSYGGVKINIQEGSTFNYVILNETIPTEDSNGFKIDMERFKDFTQSKLNETTLAIDLNFTELEKCLPLTISPYNISYTHPDRPAGGVKCLPNQQEEIQIIPTGSGIYINDYNIVIEVNSSIGEAGGSRNSARCRRDATLIWNITIIGTNTAYNEVDKIKPTENCIFNIKDLLDNKILDIRNDATSVLSVLVQPGYKVNSSIALNLTDIPGKTWIGLPPQAIKVKETLYQIEKNDTIYIYGE